MYRKEKRKIPDMKLLGSVSTEAEAVVLQGLLDSCDIYTRLEYDTEAGAPIKVVLGTTNLGVNIYVREDDYDDALEILHARKTEEE